MTTRRFMMTGVTVMALAAGLQAQTTTKTKQSGGAPKYSATSISGDVVMVDGNYLLVRMTPGGAFRAFIVPRGRQFVIDGQPKLIGDLRPGTSLTATVITRTQPVSLRTKTVTNGTVWYASGNYVIITLENGENREYNVPESYKFMVEGKPASASDLKKGMKVSGTKIVSEPQTEISTETVVTGRAPR